MTASDPAEPDNDAAWRADDGDPLRSPSDMMWGDAAESSAVPTYSLGGPVTPPSRGTPVPLPPLPTSTPLGYAYDPLAGAGTGYAPPTADPVMAGLTGPPPAADSPDPPPPATPPPTPAPAAAAPTVTHGRQRHGRLGPMLAAVLTPVLMVILGLSLMVSSLAGSTSSSSASDRESPPKVTTERPKANSKPDEEESATDSTSAESTPVTPAVPVIAVPTAGDPAQRATTIAQTFLTALANEDFRTARAMTDTDVDEEALQNLNGASAIPVTTSQTGPDRVAMRLVIVEYRTIDAQPTTTFICADWNISTATGRVEQLTSAVLGEPQIGTVVPGDLALTLAAECDALVFE